MSRSVHTRPKRVLAAERARAPYAPRGAADRQRRYRLQRALKERGIPCAEMPAFDDAACPLRPRILVARPPHGWHHPAGPAEIARLLRRFGPETSYGLRSIELVWPEPASPGRLQLGRLVIPGRIVLYAQSLPPWTLAGTITGEERARLERAGAVLRESAAGLHTVVDWPGDSLRDFMLHHVLLHELGHHVAQHSTGKRRARVLRTRDHEAFAELFAQRCRQELAAV